MLILGIETSCDETGVALYDSARGLLAETLYSQVSLHARYGGVVPELASRDHVRKLVPLVQAVLNNAQLPFTAIEGIAYTAGPGLAGALLVGATFARSLAFALQVPTLGVHHLEAHLLAAMLSDNPPSFPFLALLVSGGHTLLIAAHALGHYEILGDTADDAVGEAFDKTAKLLGLPYPGGAALAKLALQGRPGRFVFPKPMVNRAGLDFSFSGLKTFAANTIAQAGSDAQTQADIAHAFETAVVATLLIKTKRALQQTGLKQVVIAGGVGANHRLRTELKVMAAKLGVSVCYPAPALCTDNGAMIAYTGCRRLQQGEREEGAELVRPRWSLALLQPPAAR